MRRIDREVVSREWMTEVLEKGEWMELALAGKDGWPYIVPLNYGFGDDFIVIHCAKRAKRSTSEREQQGRVQRYGRWKSSAMKRTRLNSA